MLHGLILIAFFNICKQLAYTGKDFTKLMISFQELANPILLMMSVNDENLRTDIATKFKENDENCSTCKDAGNCSVFDLIENNEVVKQIQDFFDAADNEESFKLFLETLKEENLN